MLAALTFAACEQALVEEQSAICPDVPETITAGFEGDDTRIQLNDAQKTVWTKGDLVSVFYRSNANQQWKYNGETGVRTADLTCVDAGEATATMNRVVVVYPYNENYKFNTETYNVQASLPATQTYLKDSYGLDGNIMVSSSEFNQFKLKTVYGWLKLQLTGNGEQIKSITLRGNNGEQIAGEAYINTTDATMTLAADKLATDDDSEAGGSLIFEDTILTEVTLDCGNGVTLGAEATAFYIALPPQTFTKGLTVEITATNGLVMTKSTDKEVVIERNHIQPMAAFAADLPAPETWKIYYTATAKVEPYDKTVFGATYVSNEWDSETGKGVITFSGDVTKIGDYAFNHCENFTSVYIPDGVTTIGDYAFFYCTSLTSVTIPGSVTTIGESAFAFCGSLTSVTIPDSVTSIGHGAFSNCGLTSVTIPDSVTSIGQGAFSNCDRLRSVTIPDSVTSIGNQAFSSCDSLTSVYCKATTPPVLGGTYVFDANSSSRKIYVPYKSVNAYKSAEYWSEYADAIVGYDFENGEILEVPSNNEIWYTTSDGNVVTPYKTTVFGANITSNKYNNGKGVITFDGDVTKIGDSAFWYRESLTSVTIPGSVTTIGYEAFRSCGLTSVTIVNGVTTIGEKAFSGCTSLTNVTIPDSVTMIRNYAFELCISLTSVTIPDSVTMIGKYAFQYCRSLTSVTIPGSVTSTGQGTFYDCEGLTSVTIGDGVTTIGRAAFEDCESLTSVTIPDTVTTIENIAFSGCIRLTSVTIPDSVTSIGNGAFYECKSLKSVYCTATTPPSLGGNLVFYYNGSGRKIYVPVGSEEAYKSAANWNEYASAIVGYDFNQ